MRNWEPQSDGTGDRALVKDFVGEIRRPLYGACVFCSRPCFGRACAAHLPLLANLPERAA